MEDENLLDDDIIVRETQDNSPTTFSRNLVNQLGLSSQQNRTETVSINNNNKIEAFQNVGGGGLLAIIFAISIIF